MGHSRSALSNSGRINAGEAEKGSASFSLPFPLSRLLCPNWKLQFCRQRASTGVQPKSIGSMLAKDESLDRDRGEAAKGLRLNGSGKKWGKGANSVSASSSDVGSIDKSLTTVFPLSTELDRMGSRSQSS